jgi:hypothetical protein
VSSAAFSRSVAIPFGILVLAFGVLFLAGQAGSLGPLDFARYQWLILALWISAPVVGGFASRVLDNRQLTSGATVLGLVLGVFVAAFFLTAAGTASSCRDAGNGHALGYALGCAGVGAIVGIGIGASELVTALLARRGWLLVPLLVGGGISLAGSVGGFSIYYSVVTCLR